MAQAAWQIPGSDRESLIAAWKTLFGADSCEESLVRDLVEFGFTVADVDRIADLAYRARKDPTTGVGQFASDYATVQSVAHEFCVLVRHWCFTAGVAPADAVPFLSLAEGLPKNAVWDMMNAASESMSAEVVGWLGLAYADGVDLAGLRDVGPLALAAGLSAAEVVEKQAAGMLDFDGLRSLALLRGYRLTGLEAR